MGLTFQACSKDDSLSKSEMLCKESWILDKAYIGISGEEEGSLDFFYDSCALDDLITFYKDGIVVREDNIDLCGGVPLETDGDWSFSDGAGELTFPLEVTTNTYTIEKLNNKVLILSDVVSFMGVVSIMNIEFVHED